MGQAQTVEQKINDAKKTIDGLHNDVNKLDQLINQEVIKLEKDIANANYTDLNELCDQISYQYVDRLSSHFPITTLEGYGRIKLGLETKPLTENMANYKQSVCKNIVAFYRKKLFLLEQVKKETPKCQEQEKIVYTDLSNKLKKEGIDTEQWMDVYKKVQSFNKDIKYQYSKINDNVRKIRESQTWTQLNVTSKNTIDLLTETNSICIRYQADLNRFSPTPVAEPKSVFNQGFDKPSLFPEQPKQTLVEEQPKQPLVEEQPKQPLVPQPKQVLVSEQPKSGFNQGFDKQPLVAEQPKQTLVPQPKQTLVAEQPKQTLVEEQPKQPLVAEQPVLVKTEPLVENTNQIPTQPVPVNSKAVMIMDYSSTKQRTLKLNKGEIVTVLSYSLPDWAKVQTSTGQIGYVGAISLGPIKE